MPLLFDTTALAIELRFAVGLILATGIALVAFRLRALTISGAIAAVTVGALTFAFGGVLVAAAIIIFFTSGSVLGRLHNATADTARTLAAKDARRDAAQVVANGGIATACAIAGGVAELFGWPHGSRWLIAAMCAVAAASGDTWSTEIGAFFRGPARLITTMQPVIAGTSGGITPLGTIAAPLGGAIIGLAGIARTDILVLPAWIALCAIVGLIGSIFDSVLGAALQGRFRCAHCAQVVETTTHARCAAQCTLVGGISWLDNDGVNGIMTLGGAALGYVLAGFSARLDP
jgi:uncharacterized protein (TIGR00297 family)